MKDTPSVLLAFCAALFVIVGITFMVAPAWIGANVNLDGSDPTARIELRAMYGGLDIGAGVFLFGCLVRRHLKTGLWFCVFGYGGLGAGRLLGIALEGGTEPIHLLLLGTEILGVVLAVLGLRLLPPRSAAASEKP